MEATNSLLQDIETELSQPTASVGQRFLNSIIDGIAYYIILFLFGMIMSAILLAAVNNGSLTPSREYSSENSGAGIQILLFLLLPFSFGIYYILFEKLSKGRTIGKFITGTKAVSLDGSDITWKQAFLRTIIRFIPFEPLSCFGGYPWHDQWSNTKVVKTR